MYVVMELISLIKSNPLIVSPILGFSNDNAEIMDASRLFLHYSMDIN